MGCSARDTVPMLNTFLALIANLARADRLPVALNGSGSAVPSLILAIEAASYDFIGRRGRPGHEAIFADDDPLAHYPGVGVVRSSEGYRSP